MSENVRGKMYGPGDVFAGAQEREKHRECVIMNSLDIRLRAYYRFRLVIAL